MFFYKGHHPSYCNLESSLSYYGYSSAVLRQMLAEKSEGLSYATEADFALGIEEIENLLRRLDPPSSTLMQAVDVKGKDYATYYYAAYSETRDLDRSLAIYGYVKDFIRVIVLMDRYFEVGNERYRRIGQGLIERLKKADNERLRGVLAYNLKQFWPFWKFEQHTKKMMIQGHVFSQNEAKCYNLFKSSDAALIYAPLLEGMLPRFTRSTSLVIHYNQALQDIDDDFDDIQEDLNDQMPNIFILASVGRNESTTFSTLYGHRMNGSKGTIIESSSETVQGIIDEYASSIEGIEIPNQFRFLKTLSKHYANRVRKKLAAASLESNRLAAAQT